MQKLKNEQNNLDYRRCIFYNIYIYYFYYEILVKNVLSIK